MRRRNRIVFFKDDNEIWISDPAKIVDHIYAYFKNCFTISHTATSWHQILLATPCFHKLNLMLLIGPFKITTSPKHSSPSSLFKVQVRMAFTPILSNRSGKL